MEFEKITPKSYPENLIKKDWSKRQLYELKATKSIQNEIHDMDVLEDDVWIVTNPKCGTTWMQELVWLLINNCDFEGALAKDLELRSPFLEYNANENQGEESSFKRVLGLPSPRVIKTHLPLPLLPAKLWQKKAKVVYVFRNPKDAWVSAYYHLVSVGVYYGKTMEQFIDDMHQMDFAKMEVTHASEFYQLRNEPWVFYTSYEQMKSNLHGVIEDLCRFLNKSVTEQQMEQLLKHLSFEEMKKNPTTNHAWEFARAEHPNKGKEVHNFLRKGQVNGYKAELTAEQIKKIDLLISQSLQENLVTLEELLLLD